MPRNRKPPLTLREQELLAALKTLYAVCLGVAPFANAVATEASVKDIRRVGKFMDACDIAEKAIERAESRRFA